ncbi:MAG: DNA methyltransferase [Thermoanaerobaculia bacterium]
MPLSWNEIRDRSVAFVREWSDESSEDAEAKSFWDAFFHVFGVERRRLAQFEAPVSLVRNAGKTGTGYVDLFWKGRLLVEHKSRGKDLDRAYAQAVDYFEGIADRDLPRYILVSDFARLRLDDLETGERHEFPLQELPKNLRLFGFIAGYEARPPRPQDPVNLAAAERMGKLHDKLKASGYEGHDLEVFLVRLLFCLFADDTGIFQPVQSFREWIENRTSPDGSDLGAKLSQFFQVLNTPNDRRQKNLDEQLVAFAYVNGKLFEERLSIPDFDAAMRTALLDAAGLDWSRISPAIFGGLFQSIMDPKARRNLGAHYTSEENILKLIEPLFLDHLRAELAAAKGNANKLFELQKKLRTLTFLDPACGCGNFLVVAYRELREIELEILRQVEKNRSLDIFHAVQVNVDQFYGIEIEEFPAQIAQVALWLTDHQMNQKVSAEFGLYFARLPLVTSPTIVHGNALRLDWETIVPRERLSYILGNPPFVGKKEQKPSQKEDVLAIFGGMAGSGVLDYVTCWYVKAAGLIERTQIRAAFVSTNSIAQGEQPGLLWPVLWKLGIKIQFAHRTFRWSNEAKGRAAVHCVIIGFGCAEVARPRLFDYSSPASSAQAMRVARINPYLVEASDVVLRKRSGPLRESVPEMRYGSMPIDDGHLILSPEEKKFAVKEEPDLKAWIRPYFGGDEFINSTVRWCLWLEGAPVELLRDSPLVRQRLSLVRSFRAASGRSETVALASRPALFGEIRQPKSRYLLVPKVSSENRPFMPIGFMPPSAIASGSALIVPGASLLHFAVLTSSMHMSWMRSVCGRMKSDYQYSAGIVYNNFPWPEGPTEKQKEAIEEGARGVLTAREEFPDSTLADLYDPLTMPPVLVKAHQKLDKAVDAAYGYKGKSTDAERVAFLFELYQKYTSLFPAEGKKAKGRSIAAKGKREK